MPFKLLRFTYKNFNELNGRRVRVRFGTLYENLRLDRGAAVLFQPTFFLIRRFVLACAVVALSESALIY